MADETIKTWLVEIKATGAEAAKAEAEGVAKAVEAQDEAVQKVGRRSRSYLNEIRAIRKEHEKLVRGQADGTYLLTRRRLQEFQVTKQQADIDARRRDVLSGAYVRQLQTAKQLTREREKVERAERRIALQNRYGRRLGGFIADHGDKFGAAGRFGMAAGTTLAAAGGGLVARGFNNTVEMNRLGVETDLAARELAGSFKPAVDTATRSVRGFRQWLERRSEGEQNAIMVGGLTLAGGLAAHVLSKQLLGMGLGSAAMAGGRMLSPLVAGGAVATVGRFGVAGGRLAMATPYLAAGSVAAAALADQASDHSYYQLFRNKGGNKFMSATAAGLASLSDVLGLDDMDEATRKKGLAKEQRREIFKNYKLEDLERAERIRQREHHRKVTPMGAGFEETGSGYYRLSESLSLLDNSLDKKSDKETLDLILKELQQINGKTPPPEGPRLNRP